MEKKRHGFVRFWLWLMLIGNLFSGIYSIYNHNVAIWAYASLDMAQQFFYFNREIAHFYSYAMIALGCIGIVNTVSAIMLLNWKKIGFWMFLVMAVLNFCLMISFGCIGGWTTAIFQSIGGAILGPIILYLILLIRKNGISCWSQLD